MADQYEEILAGSLALGYLDCTLLEYARGIKYFVDQESRKLDCDTHLINLLRRAACVGWENIHMFKQPPNFSPSDFEQLMRLRKTCEAARDWFTWWIESTEACPPAGIPGAVQVLAALREALAPTGEQS